jgi:hypothetical protein
MPRDSMVHSNQSSAADSPFDVADETDHPALAAVMPRVPLGAGARERCVGVPLFAPAQRWTCPLTETETNSAGFSCRFEP